MNIIFIRTIDTNKNAVRINLFVPKGGHNLSNSLPLFHTIYFISELYDLKNYMIIIFPSVTNL